MVGIIYCITNTVTNEKYIGKTTTTLIRRYSDHIQMARKLSKLGWLNFRSLLYPSMLKYGIDVFEVKEIAKAGSLEELNFLEKYYIRLFQTQAPTGLNLTEGGNGSGPTTEETKRKLSKLRLAHNPFKGKHHTEETKKILSEKGKKHVGWHLSEEQKKKVKDAAKNRDFNKGKNPNATPLKCITLDIEFSCVKDAAQWCLTNGYIKSIETFKTYVIKQRREGRTTFLIGGLEWVELKKQVTKFTKGETE